MSLTITTAQAAILSAAGTQNHPFFAWENLLTSATTESGTADTDGAASNALTGSTYDYWVGVPTTDEVALRGTMTAAAAVDFLAVGAHNLGTLAAGIVPQTAGASRTNLLARSQDFTTGWGTSGATIAATTLIGPDGSASAARVQESATTAQHFVTNSTSVSFTSGTSYTVSIFVRRSVGTRHFGIALPSAIFGATVSVAFDLGGGAYTIETAGTATTAGIEAYAASASGATWYRVWVRSQATASASSALISYCISNSTTDGNPSYAGDGASSIALWGAQVETGAITSYVRTTTAPASSPWYDWSNWQIAADDGVIGWHFAEVSTASTWRVLVRNVSSSAKPVIGVFFAGKTLTMGRPFYQGYAPVIVPTEVELQSNVSAGGHLLGSSVVKRGSRVQMDFANLDDTFVRGARFKSFMAHFNDGGGAFAAWRPTKYPEDLHYFWRDGATIRPVNSGPRDLMGLTIEGRVYEP